jgi:DNA polymerase
MKREDYYIANICKCRPENNRVPLEEEAVACLPHLQKQISIIKPKVIVCMGATPLKYLVDKNVQITKIRGNWIQKENYIIMPTYHPAALLRDVSKKVPFWEDLKKVREYLKAL